MNCDITSDLPKSADPNGVTRRGSCSLLCPLLFPPPGALKTLNPSPPLPPPPTKCGLPRKHPKRPLVVLRPALDGYGSTTEHSAAVRARLQPTSVLARGAPNPKKQQKPAVVHLLCNVSPMGPRTNSGSGSRSYLKISWLSLAKITWLSSSS